MIEERVSGVEGQSFKEDVGWVATGSKVNPIVRTLAACARVTIHWAKQWKLEIDSPKTEAALFTHRGGHMKHLQRKVTAKIIVGSGFVRYNQEATRWPRVWMDAHITFKGHHNRCVNNVRAGEGRLRSLTGRY